MIDFSEAYIADLAVHLVGNKCKDEKLTLTNAVSTIDDETTPQYIKQYFFSSFNFELSYQFTHETDVNLNELYTYCSSIFHSPNMLLEQSINIAKHLYEVSTHPNIKRGEVYIAFVKNCMIDGCQSNAVGIFKSETKDFYLDLNKTENSFNFSCKKGINTKKLDKGCLILDCNSKLPQKIFIVDTSHNDALYWKKDFLRAVEIENEYSSTSNILNVCRGFARKSSGVEQAEKIAFLNNSVQYFESHDNYDFDEFTKNTCKNEMHCEVLKTYIHDNGFEKDFKGSFEISKPAVSVAKKRIRNYIKLDSNIEIKIPTKLDSVDKIIEQGFDSEKNMRYYKIYYTTEK